MRVVRVGGAIGSSKTMGTGSARDVAVKIVLHPVFLVALATLVLNDRVLKRLWPGWMSGKLSDAAGLIVCPLLMLAMLYLVIRPARPPLALGWEIAPVLITVAGFAAVQLIPEAGRVYDVVTTSLMTSVPGFGGFVGSTTPDPSDLVVLPAVFVAIRVGHSCGRCQLSHGGLPSGGPGSLTARFIGRE